MSLSDQELKEIAYLARINVKDESLSSLKVELEEILKLFEELSEADTSDVDAMSPVSYTHLTLPTICSV